jgi:hypothetical protein
MVKPIFSLGNGCVIGLGKQDKGDEPANRQRKRGDFWVEKGESNAFNKH